MNGGFKWMTGMAWMEDGLDGLQLELELQLDWNWDAEGALP